MFKSFFMIIAFLGLLFVFEAEAVVIDGVDWAQPADFKNEYSYDDLLELFDASTGKLKIDDNNPLYTVFKGYTWATDQEVVTMIRGLTKQPITMETERLWNNDYNGEIDAVMDVFNTHNDKSQRYYWLGGWARKMTDSNIIFNTGFFTEIEIPIGVEERYAFWESGEWMPHVGSYYKTNDAGVWMYRSEMPPVPETTVFNNSEYKLTTESRSWFDAEAEAIAWGGHLVTINDQAEQDWLVSTFGTDTFWIGFNDIEEEGVWVWASGEEVTYTNWAPGEPNNTTPEGFAENLAGMNWGGGESVQWNDFPDFAGFFGIMERPVPDPIKTTALLTATEADYIVTAGNDMQLYGTFLPNHIILESGAKAELINFPGQNTIEIQSSSDLFNISRSGTIVTFDGSDGTILKIPATTSVQTVDFTNGMPMTLSIYNGQVMLDDQLVTTTVAAISGESGLAGTCGAYVTPGVWKEFGCYNLAAIGKTTNDDPFTPSWRLIGGYWQWGRKGPDPSQWYDTNMPNFAHGPTGEGSSDANSGAINPWDSSNPPNGAWSDSVKTSNDPCPIGFRIPTKSQWVGVLDNNTHSTVGTWSTSSWDDYTNYSSAMFFGSDLMLPAAGGRTNENGALYTRGLGYYWSSSELTSSYYAWHLYFGSGHTGTYDSYRLSGFSVRCISE